MALSRLLARQLLRPSGPIGRWVLPRIFNRRNLALNELTLKRLDLRADDRVLEVGFGGGYLLGRIAETVTDGSIAGVDASRAMVAFCRRQHRSLVTDGRLDLRQASVEALPYPSDTFTRACTVNTIFYMADVPGALSELRRVLIDGGTLAVCFTCREFLEDRRFVQHGLSLYDAEEVRSLMAAAGFCGIDGARGSDRWREFECLTGRK